MRSLLLAAAYVVLLGVTLGYLAWMVYQLVEEAGL